jgi:histidyl-tRNA synthetase
MSKHIEPLRGVHDVLPAQAPYWQLLEAAVREAMLAYGYEELRVPIIEHTQLFKRSLGDFTDIVEKEMFSFVDRGEDHITLRPEATAGVVRSVISNGLLREGRLRVWCMGPMFRRERPQAGRFRQFHQIDVESFGFAGPDIDAELILLSARIFKTLGLGNLKLTLNSLGTPAVRAAYREKLVEYFRVHQGRLDEDSVRRLEGNPLRILDSKNPDLQGLIAAAPRMLDSLDGESAAHFDGLCAHLSAAGVDFEVNPLLVRGLDYYTHTVFEWVTDLLGAQSTVCAGGRYDGLTAQLGGTPTPGIGWAMGQERVILMMEKLGIAAPRQHPDVYLVLAGEAAGRAGVALAERLRNEVAGLKLQINLGGGNFKTQFKRADKSGAGLALILGDEEIARGVAAIKPLRSEDGQQECALPALSERIAGLLGLKLRRAE